MSDDMNSLATLLERLSNLGQGRSRVAFGELMDAIGSRSYGPFLLVPALLEISPIGGIPGVPTLLAAIIVIFSIQMFLGRHHFWVPRAVEKIEIPADRLTSAMNWIKPRVTLLDKWFKFRFPALSTPLAARVAAAFCILLSLTVPLLEFVPFASTAPMVAVACFGLALLVRDGALMLGAFGLCALALVVGLVTFIPGG